jgi:hypothetical protein
MQGTEHALGRDEEVVRQAGDSDEAEASRVDRQNPFEIRRTHDRGGVDRLKLRTAAARQETSRGKFVEGLP